ncbi:MAG: alpha/beta hydrolase [Alphaproteobacteria bacterium]|nr:alpha/beta hydrolase [Alphaproteobacteria bacterium]
MPPRRPGGPTSHTFFSQRLRLHYVDWGNHGAPPLLLLHGGRDHCRNWDWVAEALRHDYHIFAPDLRGHGDSEWMRGGLYGMSEYTYDLAQLLHQTALTPIRILAHSLGGSITLRYAGIYPENVYKLLAIEGLGQSPRMIAERASLAPHERMQAWIAEMRRLAGRAPRRYATLAEAVQRMRGENPHLSHAQAHHLTLHGMHQNEDGTYSWKFDNNVRVDRPFGMDVAETQALWARITCPTLLVYGNESRASDPVKDGRAAHFRNARILRIDGAGHWVHHDQLVAFLAHARAFLAE